MSLKNTDLANESEIRTSKLEEVVEKWNKVYEMTNGRRDMLMKEIESRESRQKTLSDCLVTLNRTGKLLSKDLKQCLSNNEAESIKQALVELERCETTLKVLQSEINSNENEFSSPRNKQEEIAAIISRCKTMKTSLLNKVGKLETILRQENEFNAEIAELLDWIASTEGALVVDFYGLGEEDRQTAALEQETLAKEFSAKKETFENLLRVGLELKSINAEENCESITSKLTELSEKWNGLERIFATQEEHVEECLRQHQTYYDSVEQLWVWMQGIGKRMNVHMETSEPNYELEAAEYLSMFREMKAKSVLLENVLKSGEKLSALLSEGEESEIQEQLERLKSEWEMLRSQVVERLKELSEIMNEDAWLKAVQVSEVASEELRALGISGQGCNVTELGVGYSSNVRGLSADGTELNRSENNLDIRKGSIKKTESTGRSSVENKAEETGLNNIQDNVDSVESYGLNENHEMKDFSAPITRSIPDSFIPCDSAVEIMKDGSQETDFSSSLQDSSDVKTEEIDIRHDTRNNLESNGVEVMAFDGDQTTQGVPEKTSPIGEGIYPDNYVQISMPIGTIGDKIDSPNSTRSISDGTEDFVQILVLPTDNNRTTIDSSEETNRISEEYPQSSVQVPIDINSNTIESSTKHSDIESCSEVVDHAPRTELFMNRIKDSEEFLDIIETKVSELNEREGSDIVIQELLAEFSDREQEFENVLETGMCLVRDIPEDEQFAVEEKIITVEDKWTTIKEGLFKRKAAVETASMLENRLQQFGKFVEEVSEFVSGKETNPEWLFTDEEAGSMIECYLGRLEREQVALKGLIEGTKDTLPNVPGKTGEKIEEKLSRVSKNQTKLARQLFEKKTMLERWFEFSLILEGVENEVDALSAEFQDLVDGEETEFIMESNLSESRVHMLKILLGSLQGKAKTLCELSKEYKDVLSCGSDCDKKFKAHERNISEKIAIVADRLEKLENYLKCFKELEVETNELQVEVRQADEALSTLDESPSKFDEVDSRFKALERLSEMKHLEENILKLEPRVKLVKEKSLERLDKLDYENSGYWFQENVQCLVSGYEKARTRVRENLESIEKQVSLKDQLEVKFLEITAFLVKVEDYLNEDEEIPRSFDVTGKEVALLNGRRFLEEMELKETDLRELMEMSRKVSTVERNDNLNEDVLQLKERFNTRLKELRKNVSCLDETLKCFSDFEQKVEELASLMYEAQGFLYGEGVETRGLQDLLELGRSCLENVQQKEGTLLELKNRVERLTESFNEDDKEVIIAELADLEKKLASLKMSVIKRISSLEALGSRHNVYRSEMNEVRNGISSLEEEMKRNDEEVISSFQKDKQPEEPDEGLLGKLPDESFLQKLEEFRTRLQNLNKMKIELEEESQETKVDLGNVLGLEPLQLTFADLEKINQEKANELRKYEEQQKIISTKVSEFEEKFKQLRTQYEENKVRLEIVSETSEKTDGLLQEVERALVDVGSVKKLTNERMEMVNRLEAIRNDCVEMQRRLTRGNANSLQLSEEYNSADTDETFTREGNTETEDIGNVIALAPHDISNQITSSDAVYNVSVSESDLAPELSETDYRQANNLVEDKFDGETHHLSEETAQQSKPQNCDGFEVLQCQVEALTNDEEILDIMISNSDFTSGNLGQELETAKAKLELVKQKENQLQVIHSQAASMWNNIPVKEQGIYEENINEIKEKLSAAGECLVTRIKMLEQCMQTKEMLKENVIECWKVIENVESRKYDLAMVKEYVEVLQDPNSCLENASRLCFALSIVGDFEEAENMREEIEDLRERWDAALERLEQQIEDVTELESLNEDAPSVNGLGEEPREVMHQGDVMRNRTLSVEQQENVIDENRVEDHGALDVHENNADSQENIALVSKKDTTQENSTFSVQQPESLAEGNAEEEAPVEVALMTGKIKKEPVIEKGSLTNDNEDVSLDYISDTPKEVTPEKCVVKEIPIEDVATRNRAVSVEQPENTLEENIVEDGTLSVRVNEHISHDTVLEKEVPGEGHLTKSLEEQDNVSYICVIQDEATSEECIVKEIPEEDVLTKDKAVSEEQHENAMNFDIVEDRTADVYDYHTDIPPDEAISEECIVKEIPEDVLMRNRAVSEEQQENAMNVNIVEDRTADVHDYHTGISQDEATSEDCIGKEIPEGVLMRNKTESEEQHENAMNFGIVEDRTADVYDYRTDIPPDDATSEECIGKEIPEDVSMRNRVVSEEQQENAMNVNIVEDQTTDVYDYLTDIPLDKATSEDCIGKEIPEEDVLMRNRAASEQQHESSMNFDIVEDRTTDAHENTSKDYASSEKYIMNKIPQVAVVNRRFSQNQPGNVLEENTVEEGRPDVYENNANLQDKIAGVSENVALEKYNAEEAPVKDALINSNTKSVEELDNTVEMDTLAVAHDKNGIILIDDRTDIPKETTSEEFIVKGTPDKEVVARGRNVLEQQQGNTLKENIMEDENSDVGEDRAIVEEFMEKEMPDKEVVARSRNVLEQQQGNTLKENVMEDENSDVGEDKAIVEEFMVKEMPEEDVVDKTLSDKPVGNVMEEDFVEDGTVHVHENKTASQENITTVSQKVSIGDCTTREVINGNIVLGNENMSVVGQQENAEAEDIVRDISQDTSVSEKADSQKIQADEVSLEGVLINGETKTLVEQDNALEKDSLAHEKEVISTDSITDIAGETNLQEYTVKETPEENVVVMRNEKLLETQENDGKENIVEDMTLDVPDNEVSSQDDINEIFLEKGTVGRIPENSVKSNSTLSEEQLRNVAEQNIGDDGTSDVHESAVTTTERSTATSQETVHKGVLMTDTAKAAEQQENDSVEDGKVLKDQFTQVQEMNADTNELPEKDILTRGKTLLEEYQDNVVEKDIVVTVTTDVEEEETNMSGILHEMNAQESSLKNSTKKDVFMNAKGEDRDDVVETNFETSETSNAFDNQGTLVEGISDIPKFEDVAQDKITSGVAQMKNVEQKEITCDEVSRAGTLYTEDEITAKGNIDKDGDSMIQDNNTSSQREKPSTKIGLNDHQTLVEFDLKDSAMPSFCVASNDDTCEESKASELEDVYYMINKVSSELALIKNIDHVQKMSPQNMLEYELRSLNELRSIETQLQSVVSKGISFDTVEKDKKNSLSKLVKEQQLEIVRVRDALNNRVRKIERFFEIKERMKDRIGALGVILDEALSVEEENSESKEFLCLEERVKKMEEVLSTDEDLSKEFVNCLESLSNEYPSLNLTYAEQIHERYEMRKSEVTALLDVAKKEVRVKLVIEEELNSCSEWLFANQRKMEEVNITTDSDVGSFEKVIEDVDSFLVGIENKIQRFCSYSISEGALLNILPKQERHTLLSKVNNLEKRLMETRAFVLKTKQDLKAKVGITKRKEKIEACQLWCEKAEELLKRTNKRSQGIFSELSDLINEGEALIENIKSEERSLSDNESCNVFELAKEMLQKAKERLQKISEKEETLKKLSYEISELESRILVPFDQNNDTVSTESWKYEEEIRNAQNRLQNISKEIKSAYPDLETYPANSRENELLRRGEYLLKEVNEVTEKRSSMQTLADCEKSLEEVKDVCNKPMMFCLDVVKMKKELAELGKISLELKDKEAKLQQVGSADKPEFYLYWIFLFRGLVRVIPY